jgi:opacity protein-like surface antigen
MLKKHIQLISLTLLLALSLPSKAVDYEEYQEKPAQGFWQLKGGAGFAMTGPILQGGAFTVPNLSLPGEIDNNQITEKSKSASFAPYLSFQKSFVFNNTPLYALAFGPTIYYEQLKSTGQITNLTGIPTFIAYNYSLKNTQIALMLEAQWSPILLWSRFAPYLVLGVGINRMTNNFNSVIQNSVQNPTPLNNANSTQYTLAADVGLGAEFMINKSLGIDLRYIYLYNFASKLTGISSTASPIPFKSNTNTILLGIVWRFAFS